MHKQKSSRTKYRDRTIAGRGGGTIPSTVPSASVLMMDPDGSYNEAPSYLEDPRHDRIVIARNFGKDGQDVYGAAQSPVVAPTTSKVSRSKQIENKKVSPSTPRLHGGKHNRSGSSNKSQGSLNISSIHVSSSPDLTESTDMSDVTTPISNPPTPQRRQKKTRVKKLDIGGPGHSGPSPPGQRRQMSIRDLLEEDQTETRDRETTGRRVYTSKETEDSVAAQDRLRREFTSTDKGSRMKRTGHSNTTDRTPSTAPEFSHRGSSPSSSSGVVQFSPIQPMTLIPSLPLQVSPPSLAKEHDHDVFALVLPIGATGLIFSGDHPPTIKGVKASSPLAGIIASGYFIVGFYVPDGSSRRLGDRGSAFEPDLDNRVGGQIFSGLSSKELQYALRFSARKAMRVLWFSRTRNLEVPKPLSSDSVWQQNRGTVCYTFSVTESKSLVSLPPGDAGINLLGNPPLIISIDANSPLAGVLVASEHHVLGLYRPKSGIHHREFDSDQLTALLLSTSRERGRVLVVTSDPNEFPSRESESSDSSMKSTLSMAKSDSTSYWSSDVLSRVKLGTEVSDEKKGEGVPSDDPIYYTNSSSTPEEVTDLGRSKKDAPQHIIVKKTWVANRSFTFSRPYQIISFHGQAMDSSIANRIQHGLNDIPSKIDAPIVRKLHSNTGDGNRSAVNAHGQYSVVCSHNFGRHHEDDAMVAILDALAGMGWSLQFAYADHQSNATSRQGHLNEKLIFHRL